MADRARAFSERLKGSWRIDILYRTEGRIKSINTFRSQLSGLNPDLIYVFDMGIAGAMAAFMHKLTNRVPLIIDTGDAIAAVGKTLGRSAVGVAATWLFEQLATRLADHIVVRGTLHGELLGRKRISATVIQDGVDIDNVNSLRVVNAKQALNFKDELVVGVVGSVVWNEKHQACYGMELVKALSLLRDTSIRGVLVGDGPGLEKLKQTSVQLGVASQLIFAGRQSGKELFKWLSAIDVCISTQTNDLVGQVRTTGKLPMYMPAGCYVLATEVGEAKLVSAREMLVPFRGSHDPDYRQRLADRLRDLDRDRGKLRLADDMPERAMKHFSYDLLAQRLHVVLSQYAA